MAQFKIGQSWNEVSFGVFDNDRRLVSTSANAPDPSEVKRGYSVKTITTTVIVVGSRYSAVCNDDMPVTRRYSTVSGNIGLIDNGAAGVFLP